MARAGTAGTAGMAGGSSWAGEAVVTGLGLVTSAGIGTDATWRGLLAGVPAAATDPELAGLPVDFSCRVPDFDAVRLLGRTAVRLNRFTAMAVLAAREAVTQAGLTADGWDATRVGVVVGTGTAGMEHYDTEFRKIDEGRHRAVSALALPRSVPNMSAAEVALDLGARGPNLVTSTACASGATAVGTGLLMLRAGMCDIAVVGGAESVCCRVPAVCFAQTRTLSTRRDDPAAASRPFDAGRDGFVLGEGAGMLVLERAAHARARRAAPRATLLGYGASCDAHHPVAPHPGGRGAADAVRAALADGGLVPADVDHVNAHGTATRHNDLAEFRALQAVFGARVPPVTANKGVLGHAVGGAGAIEAAATVLSLDGQVIPPTANLDQRDPDIDLDIVAKAPREARLRIALTQSFGFGGQNAALVFAAV